MDEKSDSLWQRINRNIRYCISGVWNDTRSLWSVKTLKIINLSVRSFLRHDLQMRASALTYNTVLAIVPALAMLFAIGRGFGFQNLLETELFRYFSAQRAALTNAMEYVDNYLSHASQGIFVGIGLVFLLWTLHSLMSNVEDTFNYIWGVTNKRSLVRKFTDYSALLLLLPVMMVCSAGISIFMSDAVQHLFEGNPLSPMAHSLLAFMPTIISWFIFTAAYSIIPNTKVSFKGALLAGVLCGTMFQVVQWLFVTGQLYVSKYNAIYGSFAFLPLMLVWIHLSWLITLAGVVLCYSWQNFNNYIYDDLAKGISQTYTNHLAIAILAMAVKRFKQKEGPLTRCELINEYDIPGLLADRLTSGLQRAGLLTTVTTMRADEEDEEQKEPAYAPTFDPDDYTVNDATNRLADLGNSDFITKADTRFAPVIDAIKAQRDKQLHGEHDVRLLDLPDIAQSQQQ